MSFWRRKKQSFGPGLSAGDAGQVRKAKRTIKRSPPLAMEVKILALEALDSGLSAMEVGELVGVGSGWSRSFKSSDPSFYKWTQWIFKLLYERGLAYRKDASVNWCPFDKTVLADEASKRSKHPFSKFAEYGSGCGSDDKRSR